MLLDLLTKKYIDKENLLLGNYKKIGLTENQLVVILLIMHMNNQTLTPKEISKYTNLTDKEVEKIFDELLDKKLIKVSSKTIDLKPLFIKLVQVLEDSLEVNDNDLIKAMNTIFETKLSLDDVNYLKEKALNKFNKEELLILAAQTSSKTFPEFKKELENKKGDVKPITKINWL